MIVFFQLIQKYYFHFPQQKKRAQNWNSLSLNEIDKTKLTSALYLSFYDSFVTFAFLHLKVFGILSPIK